MPPRPVEQGPYMVLTVTEEGVESIKCSAETAADETGALGILLAIRPIVEQIRQHFKKGKEPHHG